MDIIQLICIRFKDNNREKEEFFNPTNDIILDRLSTMDLSNRSKIVMYFEEDNYSGNILAFSVEKERVVIRVAYDIIQDNEEKYDSMQILHDPIFVHENYYKRLIDQADEEIDYDNLDIIIENAPDPWTIDRTVEKDLGYKILEQFVLNGRFPKYAVWGPNGHKEEFSYLVED